jgi:hypothetical protein
LIPIGVNSSQVTAAANRYLLMPTGGVQAGDLPLFVTDFDCGKDLGGFSFLLSDSGSAWLGLLGFGVPCIQGSRASSQAVLGWLYCRRNVIPYCYSKNRNEIDTKSKGDVRMPSSRCSMAIFTREV